MIVFGERTKTVTPALVVDISGAHASGDTVVAPTVLQGVSSDEGGLTNLAKIIVRDVNAQASAYRVYFFDKQPTGTYTKNGAFALTDADVAAYVGHVDVSATIAGTNCSFQVAVPSPRIPFKTYAGKDLWIIVTTTSTPTFVAASDLSMVFQFVYA